MGCTHPLRLGAQTIGFIAQEMSKGVGEAVPGYRHDPLIWPVTGLGAGLMLAEMYQDGALRLAPVTDVEALETIPERFCCMSMEPRLGCRKLPC